MSIHKSVLLKESIDNLNLKSGDVVVDATLGGGGHSFEILKKIMPGGTLIAIDKDKKAIDLFKKRIYNLKLNPKKESIKIIRANFADLKKILTLLKVDSVDAIVADLGVSLDQINEPTRGFSFQKEGRLDMRMDCCQKLSAWNVINEYDQDKIEKIIRFFGEEKFAKLISKAIVKKRKQKSIETTTELAEIIRGVVEKKYRRAKIHFATRTFQAIRMEVNKEIDNLEKFLRSALDCLKKGGRMAIIAFHSGEDRVVKSIFMENARGCICSSAIQLQKLQEKYIKAVEENSFFANKLEKMLQGGFFKAGKCFCGCKPKIKIISRKPIGSSLREISENPRARSAKMRIIEKI